MRFPEIKEMMGALREYLSFVADVRYDAATFEFITTEITYTAHPDGMGVLDEVESITKYSFKQAYDIWTFIEENPNWDSMQGEWYDKMYGPSETDKHYLYVEPDQTCPNYEIDELLPF